MQSTWEAIGSVKAHKITNDPLVYRILLEKKMLNKNSNTWFDESNESETDILTSNKTFVKDYKTG